MSNQTIKWHENSLENYKNSNLKEIADLKSKLSRLVEDKLNEIFREIQIEEAKKQNKTEFDQEKFLKNKKNEIKSKYLKVIKSLLTNLIS